MDKEVVDAITRSKKIEELVTKIAAEAQRFTDDPEIGMDALALCIVTLAKRTSYERSSDLRKWHWHCRHKRTGHSLGDVEDDKQSPTRHHQYNPR